MIRIKELYRLQNIKRLRLVAGQVGLERAVTAAVLFEYDPSRMQLPDFYKGDLVVTTLAYARGDDELVSQSLLSLMNQGIACLLVKTAYFGELPQDVLTMANQLGTPIFLFDETYIEEVILEVTELIRGKRHFSGYEKELDALMRGEMTADQIKTAVQRIDPDCAGEYRLLALYPRERLAMLEDRIYAAFSENTQLAQRFVCMEWKRMLIVFCREDSADGGAAELLACAGVSPENIFVGVSEMRAETLSFGMALCEAIYSARTAKLLGKRLMAAQDLGVYAYLYPMSENPFVCDQCRRSLSRIRQYDVQNRTNLEHTARTYVEHGMEISATAKALFQHPNTVRYRLGKIQSLMQLTSDALFAPMLSLTVNLSSILEADGNV